MTGITDPTEGFFKDGQWGWDGTLWRKLPLVFGYSDRLALSVAHTKVGDGDYVLTVATCPEGEIYIINAIFSYNLDSAINHVHMLDNGSVEYHLEKFTTPAAGAHVAHANVNYILKKDDEVQILFSSANADDRLRGQVWGYIMKVAE